MEKFLNGNEYSLTKNEVASYFENGYTIVPKLFKDHELSILKSHAKSAFSIAKDVAQKYVEENNIGVDEFRFDHYSDDGQSSASIMTVGDKNDLAIKLISWVGSLKPELFDFARSPKITVPVSQLLGSGDISHLLNQLHYKLPNDRVTFGWHQDIQNRRLLDHNWKDLNKKGSFVQVITAIDDCTLTNGPLIIIPNSHKKHLFLERIISDEENLLRVEKEYDVSQSQPLLLKAGDTLFMHPLLLHKSDANISTTGETRGLFINGFSFPKANNGSYPGRGSCQDISVNVPSNLLIETNEFASKYVHH